MQNKQQMAERDHYGRHPLIRKVGDLAVEITGSRLLIV